MDAKFGESARILEDFHQASDRYQLSVIFALTGSMGTAISGYQLYTGKELQTLKDAAARYEYPQKTTDIRIPSEPDPMAPIVKAAIEKQKPSVKVSFEDGIFKADKISKQDSNFNLPKFREYVETTVQNKINHYNDPIWALTAVCAFTAIGSTYLAFKNRKLARQLVSKHAPESLTAAENNQPSP